MPGFAAPLGLRVLTGPHRSSRARGRSSERLPTSTPQARDAGPRDERMVELDDPRGGGRYERSRAEAALRELNETLEQRVEAETRERLRIWKVSQDLLAMSTWTQVSQRQSGVDRDARLAGSGSGGASRPSGCCTRTIRNSTAPSSTASPRATRRCASKTAFGRRTVHITGYRGRPRRTTSGFTE